MKRQSGFTLIELVVVIVILGILAKVAAPKFLALTTDARIAVIDGMAGAAKSAVNLVYSSSVIKGNDKYQMAAGMKVIDVERISVCPSDSQSSSTVCTTFGNPSALYNGIVKALDSEASFKRMTSAGACDALWGWCYYNPNTLGTHSGGSQPYLDSGVGTIYIAPAHSSGYTSDLSTSCVLSYTVEINSGNTSTVLVAKFTDGC